jgi:cytoskeleton protein RodZ
MDSDEPQQSAVGEPAGQQLKRAREKRGLSLSDIADAQHLRVSVIQAIEDGHHDQIDSELFLKGYVRAYARQVGADADALIQSLDRELEPLRKEREKQEQEDPLVDIERRRRKKRRLARVLGIIVVLGAVTLAVWKLVIEPRMADGLPGISAQSENTGGLNRDQPDSEPEPGQNLAPAERADPVEPSGYADSSVDKAVDIAVDSAAESPVDNSMDSNEPGGGPEPSENTSEVMGVADSTRGNEPVALEPVTSEPAVQPDPVFAESAQPEAVVAPVRLEMSFISDCWVQVTDAAGARLVASLQRDGDQVSVSGRAPLNVVIGAVDAVDTVRFAGEPVDLSDFRVFNNRTEFTLTL